MNYPLISEYIESIMSAEDNFDELSYLRPVLGDDGLPVMTNGNFAVIFKMMDEREGKFYALKCFTREQEGRAEAYRQIAEELECVNSTFLTPIKYLDKELFVDTVQTDETEFPALLMDWVEGKTLDKYLRENLDDKYALEMLAYRFSQLAQWLIPQPFAHGDLKPDNILVREDGTLVLVDYDGMYVPAMKGQKARELGSPNFRHPLRTENDFDEHIDDFPIVSILLSLEAISQKPSLFIPYVTGDKLLFEEKDYYAINNCKIIPLLNSLLNNGELINLLGTFYILLQSRFFPNSLSSIIKIHQSTDTLIRSDSEKELKEKILYFYKNINIAPCKIVYLLSDLFAENGLRQYWLPRNLWDICHVNPIWCDKSTYSSPYSWAVDYDGIIYSVVGEFSKKSRPNIFKLDESILKRDYSYVVDYTYDILNEMNVLTYFVDNVMKLIEIIDVDNLFGLDREDLPF